MSISNENNSDSSPLIDFYRNKGRTVSSHFHTGSYMLNEIYNWNYDELEYIHDYIQWLFPLTERSSFNPQAPVLTEREIERFRSDDFLKENLIKSFKLMMAFYGFDCDDSGELIYVKKSESYDERVGKWLTQGNHNYLRITRILKSLKILGLERYAQAFFTTLDEVYRQNSERISSRTYIFWEEAASVTNA